MTPCTPFLNYGALVMQTSILRHHHRLANNFYGKSTLINSSASHWEYFSLDQPDSVVCEPASLDV
jgi:hypothetical protein